MKKIPSIDMNRIEEVVYDYTKGQLSHVHDGRARVNMVYVTTPEDYLAEFTKYDRAISRKEMVKSLTCLLNAGVLDKDSETLCHLLIGNTRCNRKIRYITDGSYRNNRIWFNNPGHLDINCLYSDKPYRPVNFDGKSMKYKFRWMMRHYDEIYFQVPLFTSIKDVYEDIVDRMAFELDYELW